MKRVLGFVAMLSSACGGASSTPSNAEGGSGRSAIASGGASGSGGSAATLAGASGTGAAAGCLTGDIDLLVTRVSGTVTLNGAAISAATQGTFTLSLRQGERDFARLTTVSDDGSTFSKLVVRGTYDLQLDYALPGGSPINTAKLQSGIVVGEEPLSLNIDIPLATVSGTITVNGAALTAATSPGTLVLRNAAGDIAGLTPSLPDGAAYSVSVVPGSYDLYCQVTAGPRLKLRSGIVVGTSPLSLDIDVPVTTVATSLTVNGAAITGADEEHARLILKNETGAGLPIWTRGVGNTSLRIVAGTYDVYLNGDPAGIVFPANEAAKVRSGLVVGSSPVSLELDIPVSTVSGTVTVSGAAISDSATRTFLLRGAAGDQVTLTVTAGSYSARIIPGTYDLYYGGASGGDVGGPAFKLRSGVVIGPSDLRLDIDLPAPTTVSGTVTMDGAAITRSNQDFSLYLLNAANDRVSLTSSPDGGVYSALAFPGTYELFYADAGQENALERPSNRSAKIGTGIVVGSSPLALDIDIPGSTFSGTVSVNGVARRDFASDPVAFFLRDERDAFAPIAFNRSGTGYSSFVVPGTYQLEYMLYGAGLDELPRNTNVALGCFIVP